MSTRAAGLGSAAVLLALACACSPSDGALKARATPTPTQSGKPPDIVPAGPARPAGATDFGYFAQVLRSTPPVQLYLDGALFFKGAAADKQAAALGQPTPVPKGYLIVNRARRLRPVTLALTVQVKGSFQLNSFAGGGYSAALQPRTVAELLGFLTSPLGPRTPFRLVYGPGGQVVKVTEQYVP